MAIVDDIGAVLVIAFFYTSEINFMSLAAGGFFMIVLVISNIIGIRNTMYYAIIGIGGLWLAFLMSGVHATIAAVLAAMTIPADVKITEKFYSEKLKNLLVKFEKAIPNNKSTLTNDQLHIIDDVRSYSIKALTPLQKLEHAMHPFVAFVVMPIFAFSNAGVVLSDGMFSQLNTPVFLGVFLGLIVGKVLGVFGFISLLVKLKWVKLPEGMNKSHLLGVAFLSAIGFTMSLFIGGLAFRNQEFMMQAKIGVLFASIVASFIGYFIIKKACQKK